MVVVGDKIIDLAVAHEALDQRDVDAAGRLALAAADGADFAVVNREKRAQPLSLSAASPQSKDGEQCSSDTIAFMATCHELDVPSALERSRSGKGGHVWLFFSEAVAASRATPPTSAAMARQRRPAANSTAAEAAALHRGGATEGAFQSLESGIPSVGTLVSVSFPRVGIRPGGELNGEWWVR
jgi:TOTE conflict system, Archaeo-Eukaryotic Primase domain